MNSFNTNICHLQCTVCRWKNSLQPEHTILAKVFRWNQNQNHIGKVSRSINGYDFNQKIQKSILSFEIFLWLSAIECDFENFNICKLTFRHVGSKAEMVWNTGQLLQAHLWKCVNQFLIIHSYINEQASGTILVSKLNRLESSLNIFKDLYKI